MQMNLASKHAYFLLEPSTKSSQKIGFEIRKYACSEARFIRCLSTDTATLIFALFDLNLHHLMHNCSHTLFTVFPIPCVKKKADSTRQIDHSRKLDCYMLSHVDMNTVCSQVDCIKISDIGWER